MQHTQGVEPHVASCQGRVPIRRCVRRTETLTDGKVAFTTKSFTKDDGTTYEPVIDPNTGEFFCTCPDHTYRHRACKHILRAVANLARSQGVFLGSELPLRRQEVLSATEAEYRAWWNGLADEELERMAPPEEVPT